MKSTPTGSKGIAWPLLLLVLGLTAYVIAGINVPVIDQGQLRGEAQRDKLLLWALLNVPRIVLPFLGTLQLASLLRGAWEVSPQLSR